MVPPAWRTLIIGPNLSAKSYHTSVLSKILS